jgi:putative Ca2+/H+ antiporter (TMEM165/GDT1 family)
VQTFLIATATVALAEIGDKTQLLALVLAARYRRPWPISIGILIATVASFVLAAVVGELLSRWLTPAILHWTVVASLLVMAVWILIPERENDAETAGSPRHGVLVATTVAFFLAELGDKTQVAVVILSAQYHPLWQLIAGATAGMLLVNVPTAWLGSHYAGRLPLRATRIAAAVLFVLLAIWTVASGMTL